MAKTSTPKQLQVTKTTRLKRLELANEARVKRGQLKKELAAGKITLHAVVQDKPKWLLGMKIFALLNYTPGVGPYKSEAFLEEIGISDNRSLGGVTTAQYERLLEATKKF